MQLPRSRRARTAYALAAMWVLVFAPFGSAFSASGPPGAVGAYCPLPAPGETPVCQAPARERYGAFFAAVEAGDIDPAQMVQIEAALTRSGDGDEGAAYLALSSLVYGYYRLALDAGAVPGSEPRLQARLVRWNQLLTRVYGADDTPPALKAAVRTAAEDLEKRVSTVGVTCTAGRVEDCENATGLVGALSAIDEGTSMRSPLSRLIERLLGPPDDPLSALPGNP